PDDPETDNNESFTYEGEWVAGEIQGQGVATYFTGDVYEGGFENGRRQGQGTIRYATGQVATGEWTDGVLDQSTAEIVTE
ncbi:MAG: hypothetical protein AAF748_06255, partial [Pseudomonadota bacterium]